MSKLADRIEALDGPDREVDCRIWCEINKGDFEAMRRVVPSYSQWRSPQYTIDMNAAMTLADGMSETQIWNIWNDALCNCSKAEKDTRKDLPRYWSASALRAKEASQ